MIMTNEMPFHLEAKDAVTLSDSVFTMMD